jgi:hypothetical protein
MRRRNHPTSSQLPLFGSDEHQRAPPEVLPYDVAIYRVTLVREASVQLPTTQLRDSRAVAAFVRERLQGADREHFIGELSRAPQSSEQFVWLNRRYGETETQLSPSAIMPSTRADSSQNAVI